MNYVVDLERHSDGEGGLVGPFSSRHQAEVYVAGLEDKFTQRYATVRPILNAFREEVVVMQITIDTEDMTRLAEVQDYADKRSISLEDAVIELVNSGLSYL